MRNKLLALLLALCMVMTMLPAVAFATENGGTTGGTENGGNTGSGDYEETPENHCSCSDYYCSAGSHVGEPMGTHEHDEIGEVSYGAVCVNVPTSGSICDECLASIAANSGNNQDDDKQDDDEQKPAEPVQPTTPTAPVVVDPNAPKTAEEFSDVPAGMWYNDDLTAMLQKGWFVGQAGGKFAPGDPTTGAEVVVILSRVLGQNLVTTGSAWSQAATTWASQKGLSDGIIITTNSSLARQDLILMLWRAAGKPESAQTLTFTDIGGVRGDSLTALKWAVEKGIVQGNPDGTANPNGATRRCEMAALMVRYDKAVNG